MDINEVKGWIKRKLGDGWVNVELTVEQIEDALEDALLWWSSRMGWYSEGTLTVAPGKVEYDLSSVDPEVLEVVNVWFPDHSMIDFAGAYAGFFDLDGFPYGDYPFRSLSGGGSYFSLVQWMQTHDMGSKILSADDDFIYRKQTKKLLLTPSPRKGGTLIYQYSTPFKQGYMSMVPLEHQYLIRRYALAEAMETLGRVRGKYSSLPAADGDVSLDAGDLLSAAENEKQRLEEEIDKYIEPTMPIIG